MILRGCGCWWNCRKPIGMHIASGLSRAFEREALLPELRRPRRVGQAALACCRRPRRTSRPAGPSDRTGRLRSAARAGRRLVRRAKPAGPHLRQAQLHRWRRCAGRRRGARAGRRCARRSAAALTRAAAAATWRSAVGAHPHAREVGLPIGRAGRGGRILHAALCVAGYGLSRGVLHLRPLRRHGDGKSGHANHDEKHLLHRRTMVIRCSSAPVSRGALPYRPALRPA